MNIKVIIPTRYDSRRFPGKPLANIGNKKLIRLVYEKVREVFDYDGVIIASDGEEIHKYVKDFARSVIVEKECSNGTERCYEALKLINDNVDFVINVQGDEILGDTIFLKSIIDDTKSMIEPYIITLATPITDCTKYNDTNIVKVVTDGLTDKAIYFSRDLGYGYEHIGVYGYTVNMLEKIVSLPDCDIEHIEKLEQLRWINNDIPVYVNVIKGTSLSINTINDISKIKI